MNPTVDKLARLHARAEAKKLRALDVQAWMLEQSKLADDYAEFLAGGSKSAEFVQLEGRKVMVRASELGRINEREVDGS